MPTLLRHLLGNLFLLFVLFTLTFVMIFNIQGDPALVRAGERADPATLEKIRREYGLDLPVVERYFREAKKIFLQADPGVSLRTRRPVTEDLALALPATFEMASLAFLWALLLGVPLGMLCARFQGSWLDLILTQLALLGVSIPVFVLGFGMILAFGNFEFLSYDGRLSLDYLDQTQSSFYFWGSLIRGDWPLVWDAATHLILPCLTLSTIPLAIIMRVTRSSFIKQAGEDWLRTARAKGLSVFQVMVRHALREAAPAIVTVAGLQVGLLMSGAVLTESIFSWPGMGKYLIESIQARDYPALQGCLLLFGALYILIHIGVDFINSLLDPRIQND